MFVGLSDFDADRTVGKPVFGWRPPAGPRRVILWSTRRAGSRRRVPGGRYRSRHPLARAPHATANAPPGSPQQPPSGSDNELELNSRTPKSSPSTKLLGLKPSEA